MRQQPALYVTFLDVGRKTQEIEVVGIFEELLGEIRLRNWKGLLKVREGFPLAGV